MKVTIEVICFVFLCLFLYTAVDKLTNLKDFQFQLIQSDLLRNNYQLVSWALPLTELVSSTLLLFYSTRKFGLWLAFTLMVLFIVYIGYMLAFSTNLPCSCAGLSKAISWKQQLYLNVLLALIAYYGIRLDNMYRLQNKEVKE